MQTKLSKIQNITLSHYCNNRLSLQNLETINSNGEKISKRVPKLKTEMQLRSNIAYTHAINVLKVESNNVSLLFNHTIGY